jgi:hypothetical protein
MANILQPLFESSFNTNNIIEEGDNGKKSLYVEGIFAQAEIVNRNKRFYPSNVLKESVKKYSDEFITRNMGASELEHPNSMAINPDRIAARIIKMNEQSENNFYGKALIVDTDCGRTAKGLIEGGFQLGMSTRAEGSVVASKAGVNVVQEGLRIVAIDLVMMPSGPDCYVSGIMESATPFWNTIEQYADGNLVESFQKEMKKMTTSQINEKKLALFQQFMESIKVKS